ncbi:MAG: hypothetical protein M3211_00785 [Actinomycetota bacterium]|nr:hypothetical protein [Actinomycetota bacterium]
MDLSSDALREVARMLEADETVPKRAVMAAASLLGEQTPEHLACWLGPAEGGGDEWQALAIVGSGLLSVAAESPSGDTSAHADDTKLGARLLPLGSLRGVEVLDLANVDEHGGLSWRNGWRVVLDDATIVIPRGTSDEEVEARDGLARALIDRLTSR